MNKINWKEKLASRKFWAAVVAFITTLLLAFGVSEDATTQVAGIITSGASLIAYILAEGWVDASRSSAVPGIILEEVEDEEGEDDGSL